MTTVRAVGAKRPRGYVAAASEPTLPWAGRVPKPAMDADSFVDYGSGFLRKSCDSCVSSKRRCDGQDPCTRCLRRKKPCHYTERKKCGPRSGQKTTNSARQQTQRASSSSPDSAASAGEDSRRHMTESVSRHHLQQHQRANRIHRHHSDVTLGRTPPSAESRNQYQGMPAGGIPAPQTTPILSAGELSGETTCVDQTDYSDNGPIPRQGLLRDESGSSWWSLDEQGGAGAGGGAVAGAGAGAAAPTRFGRPPAPTRGASWPHHHHHQQQQQQPKGRDANEDCGEGADQFGKERQARGAGLWSGLHSNSAGGGTGSGSAGSAGESWEDDESDEGLGQAEEVAALLLGLGKTTEEFEGFSDSEEPTPPRPVHTSSVPSVRVFAGAAARPLAVSKTSQEWSV